jgi:polyisoprenyl-teichoic acid--peptidoglycan teichoic acid transferase
MDFRTRKISRGPLSSEKHARPSGRLSLKRLPPQLKIHAITLIGALGAVVLLLFVIFQLARSLDFTNIIFSFGKNLQSDEKGMTNILLTGVGGVDHDGPSLTDTIIIAGIDYKNKLVPMLSVPRDLFVETKQTGRSRINEVLFTAINKYGKEEGMNVLKDTIGKLTGLPIQYYIKIDFSGFEKIVDDLGGVDVVVENDIYDPEYPKDGTIQYETFSIKKGLQHLDGKTALKYARSRHGNSGGDFGRAKRQQQLLYAIKDRALSLDILTSPDKIQKLFASVSDSIETNLSLPEIIELAKLAKDMGKESTVPLVINDDPTECGGLLYTPAREFFGGASVLLPAGGNYDYINLFVSNVYGKIAIVEAAKNEKIQILNGTKTAGLAYEGMSLLSRFCLNTVYYSNAADRTLEESTIYYLPGPDGEKPAALDIINSIMPELKNVAGIPPAYLEDEKRTDSAIVIELGRDYLSKRIPDPFNSLKYLAAPASTSSTSTQETKASSPETTADGTTTKSATKTDGNP